ncbi:MAG: DEAD/DEAH box helicase [Chitinophagales bacterium]|nr:DEAD/DEAH box helicase [Chitinophagales bacterium]
MIDDVQTDVVRKLYPYQEVYIEKIYNELIDENRKGNILFQLPTGGGKTIIFSEIVRRYIHKTNGRVLILTHRIELLKQTAKALQEANVNSKLIVSEVGDFDNQDEFTCFLAMVETLNNRLKTDQLYIDNINLVIVDEAHYNSFRKIFHYFKNATILGVTATPLSSNQQLPLRDNYSKLIIGDSIKELIENGYLSKAITYTYDVRLGGLKIGMDGDYTVSSLDRIYSAYEMQERLLDAYKAKALGSKTLIFNSSIAMSRQVYLLFQDAGFDIRHLDSSNNKQERNETLEWFKNTPGSIITSVGILTTGFDEPTVETIILNRATRSLTLYHQMIGRGSRRLENKDHFTIIDLGNNAKRLGLWQDYIDWQDVFIHPDKFLEHLVEREDKLQKGLMYTLPDIIKEKFPKTDDFNFDMEEEYYKLLSKAQKTTAAIDLSIDDHYERIKENAEDMFDAIDLLNILQDEIEYRLNVYTNCMAKTTRNYFKWLLENYNDEIKKRIRSEIPMPVEE